MRHWNVTFPNCCSVLILVITARDWRYNEVVSREAGKAEEEFPGLQNNEHGIKLLLRASVDEYIKDTSLNACSHIDRYTSASITQFNASRSCCCCCCLLCMSRWIVLRLFRHYVLIVDKMIQFSTEFIFVRRARRMRLSQ